MRNDGLLDTESFVIFHSSEIRDLLSILVYDRKAFFLFWPKPKLAKTAIFLFGRNRKDFSILAETDTETETAEFESFMKLGVCSS